MADFVGCLVCGGNENTPFAAVSGKHLCRCCGCGFIYANPRPTPAEVAAFYASEYYDPYLEAREANEASYEATLDEIEKRTPRGRILDVGCGIGLFLAAARRRGWRVQGVEPSPWPAAFARDAQGLCVEVTALESAGFPEASVDVITFWSTLEHLRDPMPVMREAMRVLRPGGTMWVGVPNTRSLGTILKGARDHNLAKPEHLLHFREATLRRFLTARVGLVDVERVYLWGDRSGFVSNAVRHLARRTKLGSEIRVVGRKPGACEGTKDAGEAADNG